MKSITLAALIAFAATGCTITGANRRSLDGQQDWSSYGVAAFETPADGYAKTAQADGVLLFAQTVAAQRQAIVAGAYAAVANSGRDVKARKEIAKTKRAVRALAGAVEGIAQAGEGGAR